MICCFALASQLAERLVATIQNGSTENLKKKELNDLLGVMKDNPLAEKATTTIQSHFRGAATRFKWMEQHYQVSSLYIRTACHGMHFSHLPGFGDVTPWHSVKAHKPHAGLTTGRAAHRATAAKGHSRICDLSAAAPALSSQAQIHSHSLPYKSTMR